MALDSPWNLVTDSVVNPPDSIRNYDYYEAAETGRCSFAMNNSAITRVFYCRFDQVYSFVDDCLGFPTLLNNAPNGYKIFRILPDQHPIVDTFWASDVSMVEGVGASSQDTTKSNVGTFLVAKLSVNYRPVDFAIKSDDAIGTISIGSATIPNELNRFVTITRSAWQPEYITLTGMLKFIQPPNHLLASPPGKLIPQYIETLTWHEVPAKTANPFFPPNDANLLACVGKVNTTAFNGHPAGTVLMLPPETKMQTPKLSTSVIFATPYIWEITLPFLIKDVGYSNITNEEMGHQYLYDLMSNRWDLATIDGLATGTRLYETEDLNKVFYIT